VVGECLDELRGRSLSRVCVEGDEDAEIPGGHHDGCAVKPDRRAAMTERGLAVHVSLHESVQHAVDLR
jgi:hypothetical protein